MRLETHAFWENGVHDQESFRVLIRRTNARGLWVRECGRDSLQENTSHQAPFLKAGHIVEEYVGRCEKVVWLNKVSVGLPPVYLEIPRHT